MYMLYSLHRRYFNMNKKYENEVKQAVIERYNDGEAVSSLVEEFGISRSTVY